MDKVFITLIAVLSGALMASGLGVHLDFIAALGLPPDDQIKAGATGLIIALAVHIVGGGSTNPFKD